MFKRTYLEKEKEIIINQINITMIQLSDQGLQNMMEHFRYP